MDLAAWETADTLARRGLLRGWASEPRPPNHHPSCADPARYVRSKTRPIQITGSASDPILLAGAHDASRALASRESTSQGSHSGER